MITEPAFHMGHKISQRMNCFTTVTPVGTFRLLVTEELNVVGIVQNHQPGVVSPVLKMMTHQLSDIRLNVVVSR